MNHQALRRTDQPLDLSSGPSSFLDPQPSSPKEASVDGQIYVLNV
jgi:hypothetical protein